jgi:hypothetical protein
MLTQMDVGGVMACAHDHAPLSKRISLMFPPAVHKCTLSLLILSEGPSLETLPVVTWRALGVIHGAYRTPSHVRRGSQLRLALGFGSWDLGFGSFWYRYGVMRKRATPRTLNLWVSPPDLRAVYLTAAYGARRVLGPAGGRHPTMLASLTNRRIVHPVLVRCRTNEFDSPAPAPRGHGQHWQARGAHRIGCARPSRRHACTAS